MIKAVFFDLDETIVPMDKDMFVKTYVKLLCQKIVPFGVDKNKLIQSVLVGKDLMRDNDGLRTNDVVFWEKILN